MLYHMRDHIPSRERIRRRNEDFRNFDPPDLGLASNLAQWVSSAAQKNQSAALNVKDASHRVYKSKFRRERDPSKTVRATTRKPNPQTRKRV